MPGERWLDDLARDLAATRSRRAALGRLGALALGAVAALVPARARASHCPGGKADCRGACVDLKTDERHCGACFSACPAGVRCRRGRCRCGKRRTLCSGECVDLKKDARHCGACGDACPLGKRCVGGRCVGECAPGTEPCGAGCCAAGQTCCAGGRGGRARAVDRPPRCVDLRSDREHCGACGRACPAGGACVDGFCTGCSAEDGCPRDQLCCESLSQAASTCCPADLTCCIGPVEARCCPGGYKCCSGTRGGVNCCPPDRECCGGASCCGPGTSCCGGEGNPPATCCPEGATCCPHGSLAGQYACCPPGRFCCPGPAESGCCAAGEACCAGRCCPPGLSCTEGRCTLPAP